MAAPGDASSADACAIVDGSGFFDSETDQWHFLAQCMNSELAWKLCHYTKAGSKDSGNSVTAKPDGKLAFSVATQPIILKLFHPMQ